MLHNSQKRFHDVMAIILSLHEPLSLSFLSTLFSGSLQVQEIAKPLGSLLDGVHDKDKPIQPLHSLFHNFLQDKSHSASFHIQILPQHSFLLGWALIACMHSTLHFNICSLKDSWLLNAAVPNLMDQVNNAIPPHLSYSCLQWMSHLQHVQAALSSKLLQGVTTFKDFFQYWLEPISLLSLSSPLLSILSAMKTCTILIAWTKVIPRLVMNI